MQGDLHAYTADYEQAVQLEPKNADVYYNWGCVEALLGHEKTALELLVKGIEIDPDLKEWAQTDPDLRSLREHPRFRALVGLPPLGEAD